MNNILLVVRVALLLSAPLALQGCAVAGAAGAVVGTGVKVTGTAVGVTAKTAGAAGRAVIPGD
jgi:hypothetical protein